MSVSSGSTYIVFNAKEEKGYYSSKELFLEYIINWEEKYYEPFIYIKISYSADECDEHSQGFIEGCNELTVEVDNVKHNEDEDIINLEATYFITQILKTEWISLSKKDLKLIEETYLLSVVSDECKSNMSDTLSIRIKDEMESNWEEKKWDNIFIDKENNLYAPNNDWEEKKNYYKIFWVERFYEGLTYLNLGWNRRCWIWLNPYNIT